RRHCRLGGRPRIPDLPSPEPSLAQSRKTREARNKGSLSPIRDDRTCVCNFDKLILSDNLNKQILETAMPTCPGLTTDFLPIPLPDYQERPVEEMRRGAQAFYEEIRTRHTVREFSDRPVPRDIIETCIRAAGTAPNGANHQPWHFSVIGDPVMKKKIRAA